MIGIIIKEFVAVTSYLLDSKFPVKKGFLLVQKEKMESLLGKNKYLPTLEKLRIWKSLNWIDTEENRMTKRVYDKSQKKYVPCVKIDLQVYDTLQKYMK